MFYYSQRYYFGYNKDEETVRKGFELRKKGNPLVRLALVILTLGIVIYTMNNLSTRPAPPSPTAPPPGITFTVIDAQFNTTPSAGTNPLEQAASAVQDARIRQLTINQAIPLIDVLFTTGSNVELLQREMQSIFCALQPHIPAGYRVRLAGKNQSDITLVTAVIQAGRVASVDCSTPINWSQVAEYSLASGL